MPRTKSTANTVTDPAKSSKRRSHGSKKEASSPLPVTSRFGVNLKKIGRRLDYFLIGPDDVAAMKEIHAIIDPMSESIVEAFYAHIGSFNQLTRIIESHSTVAALKKTLTQFVTEIGVDMDTMEYVEKRLQVGLVHCKIGLKPRWYLGAYAHLESMLHDILHEVCGADAERYKRLSSSLRKVMMFDVSLGIDSYHLDMIGALETSLAKTRKNEQELKKTARLDALTGTMNRRSMSHALGKELERSRRYNHPLALAFVDLDLFKNINDTHGHLFGDRVIKEACRVMRDTIRMPDLLGRWGGEEFVIALVECPRDDAVRICERLRRAVAANMIQKRLTGVFVQVTVSVGLHIPAPGEDVPTALRHADRALYAAKKAGRNRVVVYEPSLDQ
jgi:diguanylate cyclase (GGDEF)-like protein